MRVPEVVAVGILRNNVSGTAIEKALHIRMIANVRQRINNPFGNFIAKVYLPLRNG